MTRPEPLPDIWFSRDLPILREVAQRIEATGEADVKDVADALGFERDTVSKAGERLEKAGYVADCMTVDIGVIRFYRVTAKGLREVGQWPNADAAADRLIAALRAAVDRAPEGPEKTKRRHALDAVLGMGREVIVGVTTSFITGQIPT